MWPYIILPILYNRKPYCFRIGRPDKSVFFSYCTLCKGSNSLTLIYNQINFFDIYQFEENIESLE
jgi:hypothetical protein